MGSAQVKKGQTLMQRVTQIFVKPASAAESAPGLPPVTEEKKAERLEAYQKFCEEQATKEPREEDKPQKKIKYRAKDFNG
jgi:hypothetical protein